MSTMLNAMFSTVIAKPRIIGVRASPAERSAPPSMKKTSMPLLVTSIDAEERQRLRLHGGRGVDQIEQDGGEE